MSKLIGRCYFKQTVNGNLLSEYSHNTSKIVKTESATLIKAINGFAGTYRSYWNETNSMIPVILEIKVKPRTSNSIYTLTWRENNIIIFWGEGMLCDDILIADYRDFDKI